MFTFFKKASKVKEGAQTQVLLPPAIPCFFPAVACGEVAFVAPPAAHRQASEVWRGGQLIGLALAFLSLTMDGFVSPNQEALFSKYKTSTHQVRAALPVSIFFS